MEFAPPVVPSGVWRREAEKIVGGGDGGYEPLGNVDLFKLRRFLEHPDAANRCSGVARTGITTTTCANVCDGTHSAHSCSLSSPWTSFQDHR